ncbi:hypothetical protein AX16_010133 [Volvariella volvacea WC 439]|nr:hypothetical protein AX16_010133 [Volvariella volvacea WC 439]
MPSNASAFPNATLDDEDRYELGKDRNLIRVFDKTSPFASIETSPPLEESLYSIVKEEAKEFLKAATGIQDDGELKRHIIDVQKKAYAVYGYPCIRCFSFANTEMTNLPAYSQALQLAEERPGALFLDIGCCLGSDVRKLAYDGWPAQNIIGSDLHKEYWACGHELFKSTPESFPASFIPGDIFDDNFLSPTPGSADTPVPDPHTLTSLNPLKSKLSVIHAGAVFHLFSEEGQLDMARRLASLLSPEPGSMIMGWHGGRPQKGYRYEVIAPHQKEKSGRDDPASDHEKNKDGVQEGKPEGKVELNKVHMFCHSPESWIEMWEGGVFTKGEVKVEARLVEMERVDLKRWVDMQDPAVRWWHLQWCVTRL